MEERPLVLEKFVTLGLNALNDALRIKPNYPVGDDNEPTNTAPAGKPDIECFYEEYNSICEVTLLKDRSQWFNKGQKQKIIPMTLKQFVKMLEILLAMKENGKRFTRNHLIELYNSLLDLKGIENSDQWMDEIHGRLNKWEKVLINGRAN